MANGLPLMAAVFFMIVPGGVVLNFTADSSGINKA